jgi:hypothetical protein
VLVLYFTLSTDRNSTTASVGKHAVYVKMDVQPISMKAAGNDTTAQYILNRATASLSIVMCDFDITLCMFNTIAIPLSDTSI